MGMENHLCVKEYGRPMAHCFRECIPVFAIFAPICSNDMSENYEV